MGYWPVVIFSTPKSVSKCLVVQVRSLLKKFFHHFQAVCTFFKSGKKTILKTKSYQGLVRWNRRNRQNGDIYKKTLFIAIIPYKYFFLFYFLRNSKIVSQSEDRMSIMYNATNVTNNISSNSYFESERQTICIEKPNDILNLHHH